MKKLMTVLLSALLIFTAFSTVTYASEYIFLSSPDEKQIIISDTANGKVISDKATALPGDLVKLTITPDDGYKLKSITLLDKFGEMPVILNADETFIMPTYNVFVRAEFEKEQSDGSTNQLSEDDGLVTFTDAISDKCTIDIRETSVPSNYTAPENTTAFMYNVSVFLDDKYTPIENNTVTVILKIPEDFSDFSQYCVSSVDENGDLSEKQTAVLQQDSLSFTSTHLGDFLIEATRYSQKFYSVTSGADSVYYKDSDKGIVIGIDADFTLLSEVSVNNTVLTKQDGEADNEKKSFTVSPSFLDNLVPGHHTINFIFSDSAETHVNFTVKTAEFYGNVDGDDIVTPGDALIVLQHSVKKITLREELLQVADVNGDEKIGPDDALLILQRAVKKIDSFPCEK